MGLLHDMNAGVGGDVSLGIAWASTIFSALFAMRLLHALWKGGDHGKLKGPLGALSVFTLALAFFAFPESERFYAESNGYKTGQLYLSFFTMLPGGMLFLAPFVLLFSGSRKSKDVGENRA